MMTFLGRGGRPALIVLAVGLLVHAGVVAFWYKRTGRIDAHAFASLDCVEYYRIAQNILGHGVFSQAAAAPFFPDTWRTPGYPFFLAGVMFLFGDSPPRLILVQQLLGLFNVLLFLRISEYWLSPRRAVIAALLFMLEPYGLYYSLWLLSTTWFLTVLLAVWYCWERSQRNPSLGWFVALGVLAGLLVLVWPLAVMVPVAMAVGMVRSHVRVWPRTSRPQFTLAMTGFVVAFGFAVGWWTARNRLVAGHWALSHQSGIVLAYFKGTEMALWRQGHSARRFIETSMNPSRAHQSHAHWESIDARLRERLADRQPEKSDELTWPNLAQGNQTSFDSFEVSGILRDIAWEDISESPLSSAVCCVVRWVENMMFPISLGLWKYEGVELGSRVRQLVLGILYLVLFVWIAAKWLRGGWEWGAAYFPASCTLALMLVTVPQVDPRFRVPVMPLLIFLALLPGNRPARSERPLSPLS